jgi:predicted MFS family arabinose efflux permease
VWGIEGWRVCFWAVALLAVLTAALISVFGTDPQYTSRWQRKDSGPRPSLRLVLQEMAYILRLKTFLIIVLQASSPACCQCLSEVFSLGLWI